MELLGVLAGVDVLELRGNPNVEIVDVTHDSRLVRPGTLFCCIPGQRADGHAFASDAVAGGAAALLVERFVDLPVTQARVDRVRSVIAIAAAQCHASPSRALTLLGVTGTNGKTTTVHMLESIGKAAGARTGMIGTVGARIDGAAVEVAHTTPEATDLQALLARMRDDGVGVVAMEVSSEGIAQGRVDETWFAAACFTNLTQDHLNFHGSMEAYFEAKRALFTPDRTAAAAVNTGDEYGLRLVESCRDAGIPLTTFDIGGPADIMAGGIAFAGGSVSFELIDTAVRVAAPVQLSMPGRHNVANALAAAATARAAGIAPDAVIAGLCAPIQVPGRFEPVDAGQPFAVYVDYAHTPDALEQALAAARAIAGDHRVVVVFGCGGDRDWEKRPVMGAVAARNADTIIITSDNPRSEPPDAIAAAISRGVEAADARADIVLDRRDAIRDALARADAGDVVVIAGKGHEPGQTTAGVTIPFDDRVVAREELEALR